jgi:hypothetical protein
MAFHVGQKVACIRVVACNCCGETGGLVLNAEFTVARVFTHPSALNGIELVETAPDPKYHIGYNAQLFRPIIKKTMEVEFTTGANPGSKKWDNRVKKRERA